MRKLGKPGEEPAPIGATGKEKRVLKKRLAKGRPGAWQRMNRSLMGKVVEGQPLADAMQDTYLEAAERGDVARRDLIPRGRTETGAVKGGTSGDAVHRPYSQQAIISSNIENFKVVMDDYLAPYKMLYEAMETATTTRRRTISTEVERFDKSIGMVVKEIKYRDIYEEVPDWPIRKECARTILMLCGADPRLVSRIEVNGQTGQVNVNIGNLYAEIGRASTPQEALDRYNELKRLEQAGELVIFPQPDGNQLIGPPQ